MKKTMALLVKSGPLKGHKYFVKTDCPVLIGRGDDANIRILNDKFCSRSQAVVFWDMKGCFVKDLESTNGTFVNGVRILDNMKLRNSDVISFGSTEIIVFIGDEQKEAVK